MRVAQACFLTDVAFGSGTPNGIRSTVPYVTATEKYTVGLPGQETGLRLADGVQYGDVVMMINKQNEYLQADHNGWIYYRAKADGNSDHFTMLSPIHREGKVSYGDQIVMRAHNGRMVSSRTGGNLEAVSMVPTDDSVFTILGIEGASTGSTFLSWFLPCSYSVSLRIFPWSSLPLLGSHPRSRHDRAPQLRGLRRCLWRWCPCVNGTNRSPGKHGRHDHPTRVGLGSVSMRCFSGL